jgi:excisionase family DNA binding protein
MPGATEHRRESPAADRPDNRLAAARRGHGPPVLYTAEEAAVILRVKKSWLGRQAAARKIPFTMLGRSYRFTSTQLDMIVRMHEVAPAPAAASPGHRSRAVSKRPPAAGRSPAPLRPRPRNVPRRAA